MRDELVLENINLIYYVLKKYNLYKSCDEYFDVCMIGLVKAAKTFDIDRGYCFSTYAIRCITNELNNYLRKDKYNFKLIPIDEVEYLLKDSFNLEEELCNKEEILKLYNEIEKLKEVERDCLIFSYGLYGVEKMKQKDIAKLLGMTQASVSRTISRTIEKLKIKLTSD